jgi:hypothetical protein
MLAFPTIRLAKTVPSSPVDNAITAVRGVAPESHRAGPVLTYGGVENSPVSKVGGSWRFTEADIDGWIRDQSSIESGSAALVGP